jgi:hypothetical protein
MAAGRQRLNSVDSAALDRCGKRQAWGAAVERELQNAGRAKASMAFLIEPGHSNYGSRVQMRRHSAAANIHDPHRLIGQRSVP